MNIKKATLKDSDAVYTLVQKTIQTVYPNYYPKEVVDFFSELHSKENIEQDILDQKVELFFDNNRLVGTGTWEENHITRVFVLPLYQKRGYGASIMYYLENQISKKYDTVQLDASLPATQFYERLGYSTIKHERWQCDNQRVLVYGIMAKKVGA